MNLTNDEMRAAVETATVETYQAMLDGAAPEVAAAIRVLRRGRYLKMIEKMTEAHVKRKTVTGLDRSVMLAFLKGARERGHEWAINNFVDHFERQDAGPFAETHTTEQ